MNDSKNERLPNRAQINQITDLQALEDMKDEVDRRIARIETDLDYRDDTEEWEGRALSALSVHRYVSTALHRRIEKLQDKTPKGKQKREECLPKTWQLIDGEYDYEDGKTKDELEAALKRIDEAMEALEIDRADETSKSEKSRDLVWIVQANSALKRVRGIRHNLSLKLSAINRAEKEAKRIEIDSSRERMFIASCKELLPQETFQMIWNRVDRMALSKLGTVR